MGRFNVSTDIVPVNQAKNQLSKYLRKINEHDEMVIITQHGKARGVLLSPQAYDKLMYENKVLSEINLGLKDIENREVYSVSEIKAMLENETE